MKYRDLLGEAKLLLKNNNIEEYESDAWLLFEEAFLMSRSDYLFKQSEEIEALQAESVKRYKEWLDRRAAHEPLQYITGIQNFMGFDFNVTPKVLIPRFDTEILVEKVLEYINALKEYKDIGSSDKCETDSAFKVLDMCTGSGCIAISVGLLAKEIGCDTLVTGADISGEALKVAKSNAEKLNCNNVRLLKSDLFDAICGDKFDIIVSNPPYIRSSVIETLSDEVRLHEPRLALDGTEDGLYFYRKITEEACGHLKTGGKIFFEIGYDQGEQVSNLLAENGFKDIRVIKDLAGLDRVVTAGKD